MLQGLKLAPSTAAEKWTDGQVDENVNELLRHTLLKVGTTKKTIFNTDSYLEA